MSVFSPFTVAVLSYLVMLAAYFRPRVRAFHMPVMGAAILFDLSMPVYLVTHRHWWQRLVEQGDFFSFLAWMHFGLLITLYALEGAQIHSALRILRGDAQARTTHHLQGRALLMVRGLVILTGGAWA